LGLGSVSLPAAEAFKLQLLVECFAVTLDLQRDFVADPWKPLWANMYFGGM
jgi:hypothetical protein